MKKIPPFARRNVNHEGMWFDRLAALLPPVAMAVIVSGVRGLTVILSAAVAAAAVEGICCYILQKRRFSIMPVIMGITAAMVCPVSIPIAMAAAGGAVAAALANLLLLFKRSEICNTAAVAWLTLLLIAPAIMSVFPDSGSVKEMPAFANPVNFVTADSILIQLKNGILPNISVQDLLLGNTQGGLGSASILALALSFIYLTARRSGAAQVTLSLLITVTVLSWLLSDMAVPFYHMALLQLSGGSLMFAAIFMASDFSAPKTLLMRVIYGVGCGVVMVIMRSVGFDEFSVPFAVTSVGLLTNLSERWLYKLRFSVISRRGKMA